jgi:hypothetical protein
MKRFLWTAPVVVVALALLAGRQDIRRFRRMQRM